MEGKGEMNFGNELPMNYSQYVQPGTKFSIFTWHGCRVKIIGLYKAMYEADAKYME